LKKYLDSPKEGLVELHRIYSNEDYLANIELGGIIQWAAYFGDLDFAMEIIEDKGNVKVSWLPKMQELRKTPRFKEFVREIGLVDYWKEYGWPDTNICRPVGDDDFVCD